MLRGTLLLESLREDATLTGFDFAVTEIGRGRPTLSSAQISAGIPPVWSAVEFEVDDERGPELAEALARMLNPGWYVNFSSETETFIVYPGKIFRYPVRDPARRAEAQAFGRALGIPDHQLDWKE